MKKTLVLAVSVAAFSCALALVPVCGDPASAQALAQGYTFSNDLSSGLSGVDVAGLQTWLIANGYDIPSISSGRLAKGYFGVQTKAAVIAYQRAVGVTANGFVGISTRNRLNKGDRGNGGSTAIAINGFDAPTSLAVGQTGTWTIRATGPKNSNISYSIIWGDEPSYEPATGAANAPSAPRFVSNTTFTHAYVQAGTYTVKVTVRSTSGMTAQARAIVKVTASKASPFRLITPNGGEVWQKGASIDILWTSPSYFAGIKAAYVDITVGQYRPSCLSGYICEPVTPFVTYLIATGVPINQNSYSWIVGQRTTSNITTEIPAGDYTMSICETGTDNCDTSDRNFTIASPASSLPDINIITPNGGERIYLNTMQQVSLNITGDPAKAGNTAYAYLMDDQNKQTYIGAYTVGHGMNNLNIQLPPALNSGMYRMYATLFNGPTMQAYDYSDAYFTVI